MQMHLVTERRTVRAGGHRHTHPVVHERMRKHLSDQLGNEFSGGFAQLSGTGVQLARQQQTGLLGDLFRRPGRRPAPSRQPRFSA